jgi:hypothetical protein
MGKARHLFSSRSCFSGSFHPTLIELLGCATMRFHSVRQSCGAHVAMGSSIARCAVPNWMLAAELLVPMTHVGSEQWESISGTWQICNCLCLLSATPYSSAHR